MSDNITIYTAYLDGREYDRREDGKELLKAALAKFKELTETLCEQVTLTVFKDTELIAFETNRRMTATFYKQVWGGRKGDDALPAGQEDFDATSAVLLLPLAKIHELKDNDDSSDSIGRDHINWDGPCFVSGFENSVLSYFGELDSFDITEKHVRLAKEKEMPVPPESHTVTLTIKVQVRAQAGKDMQDFVDNLNYSVTSQTPGISVTDTEVINSEVS